MKWGKSIAFFSLIFIMGYQILHKTGFQVYFVAQRATITEQHCVNKNRPELKCDGKCHLKDYLAQEYGIQAQEEPAPEPIPRIKDLSNWNLFIVEIPALEATYTLPFFFIHNCALFNFKEHFKPSSWLQEVFRPPVF